MPADLTPTDAALLDRWAGALARLAEGPTEYGPHDVGALAVENARLKAELAEALATLANERGEGEPPDPSFKWRAGRWVSDTIGAQIVRGERGWHVEDLWYDAHVQHSEPAHPSARVAMIAASAAKGGAR